MSETAMVEHVDRRARKNYYREATRRYYIERGLAPRLVYLLASDENWEPCISSRVLLALSNWGQRDIADAANWALNLNVTALPKQVGLQTYLFLVERLAGASYVGHNTTSPHVDEPADVGRKDGAGDDE